MQTSASSESVQLEGLAEVLSGLDPRSGPADAQSRRQAAIVAFGRRTVARPAIGVLMQDAVALVGEVLGAGLAGVTEVTDRGRTIVTTVASLDPDGRMAKPVSQRMPLNSVNSMAAFALTMANTVVTANLSAETAYQDLFLRNLGVRSALCVPIHVNGDPLGTLGVYCLESRQFQSDDAGFAESIAHLLAATIARVHAEEELAEQRQLAHSVLDSVDSLVLTLNREGSVLGMNGASEQLLGFSPAELEGKPLVGALLPPKAVAPFARFFHNVLEGKEPRGFDVQLIAKDGEPRTVRLRGSLLPESSGRRTKVLLTGVDRTEVARLADELLRVRSRGPEPSEPDEANTATPARPGTSAPFQPLRRPPQGHEMRSSPRRTYQYRQLIAPLLGNRLPARNRFFEVVCEDISAGGIAFYLDSRPGFERVVVGLGQPPQLTFFTADIVRIAETEADGRRQFLVGCRFTGRIRK